VTGAEEGRECGGGSSCDDVCMAGNSDKGRSYTRKLCLGEEKQLRRKAEGERMKAEVRRRGGMISAAIYVAAMSDREN
jgi:hypothetical protein